MSVWAWSACRTPASAAARSRSGVEPSPASAAAAAQRPIAAMGMIAAERTLRRLWRPSLVSTASASKPVGSARVKACSASARSSASLAWPSASGSGSAGVPHSTRRSASTDCASSSPPASEAQCAASRATTGPWTPQCVSAAWTATSHSGAGGISGSWITAPRRVEAGVSSRRAWLPRDDPHDPLPRRRPVGRHELQRPARERVDERGQHRRQLERRDARVVQVEHQRGQLRRRLRQRVEVAGALDVAPRAHPRPGLGRVQIGVLQHADEAPALGDHRGVADAALEHLVQDLAGQTVRADRVGGRGHRGIDPDRARAAHRQHAGAQIAVGEHPPSAALELDDRGADPGRGHPLGHEPDVLRRLAGHRGRADQLDHRLVVDVGAAGAQLAAPRAVQQRPCHLDGDAVAERVLGGARLETGRQPGQHRGVAEGVARSQQVQQPALVGDVDAAGVDHAQERDGTVVLGQDDGAAQVKLDRRLSRNVGQLVRRERVERRPLRQEARDLAQAGVQLTLLSRITRQRYATAQRSSPSRCARCTASVRLRTPSLRYTELECSLTVWRERCSASPISGLVAPEAISSSTVALAVGQAERRPGDPGARTPSCRCPTIRTALAILRRRPVLVGEARGAGRRAPPAGVIRPAPENSRTRSSARSRSALADLRPGLLADEQVDERDVGR